MCTSTLTVGTPVPCLEKLKIFVRVLEPFYKIRFLFQAVMDPKHNPGFVQHDGSPIEFGGNTPTGGKFAEPWDIHGWTADPKHRGDSGFKTKAKSYYGGRQARIQKEVSKCTPEDRDE